MKLLVFDAVILAVTAVVALVGGSIVWHKMANIPPSLEVAEPDGREPPDAQGPDDDAWDRGHDEYMDRQVGL